MDAKEYFEKEYGYEHIKLVAEMKDWVSLYGLIDEFIEWKEKKRNPFKYFCKNCNHIKVRDEGDWCESCINDESW